MKNIFLFIALFGGASLLAQNVGVDQTNPASKLDVNGNLSVGSSYSGTFTAPVNGAIFEGKVGIGTSNPTGNLDVRGEDAQLSISIPNGNNWTFTHYFDNENLYIQRRLGSGGFGGNLVVIDTIGKMGLKLGGSYPPLSDLHIKQSASTISRGIRLEQSSNTNFWTTYIDYLNDNYCFSYNGNLKSWIVDSDGYYSNVSDIRLKKDIKSMSNILPKVLALNPSIYKYKSQSEDDETVSIGFISQEVEALFPSIVSEQNGIKGLKYSEFSVMAIKAIQEQQQIIDAQQSEIESLKDQLNKILSTMEKAGMKVN